MPGSTAETLLLNTIFSAALEKRATDIHLMAGNYPIFRVGEALNVLADQPILNVELLQALVGMMLTPADQELLTTQKEVKTVYTWANRARFRATAYYQNGYPAFSFRLIPEALPSPQELGMPDAVIERAGRRQGLILIAGPFNSGRTTTMASLLQYINTMRSTRILTIERPVEYALVNAKSLVNQREVGRDTPSFSAAVRDALDEDVEVVGVGELMEEGIFESVLTLAESGKLVLGIMNANSSIAAIEQFITNIPEDKRRWAKDVLSTLLLAVINQRLVPAIGGGHALAVGVLTMTPAVASVIQDEHYQQLQTVMQTSRDEGMIPLDIRLQELIKSGKITSEAARSQAVDPSAIH